MANVNAAAGLQPVKRLDGSPWTAGARMYSIASNDGNAFAIGDPVASSGSADTAGVAGVTLATGGTGNAIRGVIVSMGGTKYGAGLVDPTNLNTTIIPATKSQVYYVMVVDDPWVIWEVQEDSVGNNLAATDVGSNINLVAGTNNGYVSGWMLDSSTVATTSTLQCRILGTVQRSDNAIGTNCKWHVLINNHELKAGVAGV